MLPRQFTQWSRDPARVRNLPTPLPKLECVTHETEGRFYQTPDGNRYRSVTTFLGSLPKEKYLEEWIKRVGEKEATKLKRQGGNRGTRLHDSIEQYLMGNMVTTKMPLDTILFKNMVPFIDRIDSIIAMEAALYSDELELAGRCDLIATLEGIPYIIDFKTMTEQREIPENYWLQVTAYSIMFREMTGFHIPRLCIAAVGDDGSLTVEYSEVSKWTKKLKILLKTPNQITIM